MWQGVSTAIYLKLFGFHDKVNLFDCLFLEHCIPHHWTPSVSQVFKEVTDYVSLNVDISDCNIICELNHQKCIELKFKFKNLLAINNFWRTVHSCLWIFNTETSYCKKKKKTGYTYYCEQWSFGKVIVISRFQCVLCDKNPLDFGVAKIFINCTHLCFLICMDCYYSRNNDFLKKYILVNILWKIFILTVKRQWKKEFLYRVWMKWEHKWKMMIRVSYVFIYTYCYNHIYTGERVQ